MYQATHTKYFKDQQELELFGEWAFGKSDAYIYDCMKLWNERHSSKLELYESQSYEDTIPKMIEIWKNETK